MEITARLTADAKVNQVKDDKQVVNFNVVVNDYYKAKGSTEATQVATYFKCSYWLGTKIADHLKKGVLVQLSGRLGIDAYIDMQGEAKASITCHVNNIKLLSKGNGQATETANTNTNTNVGTPAPETVDDLPF